MSLEQSMHIANFESTKPNTSTVAEVDENSEKSELNTDQENSEVQCQFEVELKGSFYSWNNIFLVEFI